jgi:anti-sigma B factor antagonist
MHFAFSHRRLDAHTSVITVEGELELVSAPRFKRELLGLLRAGHSRFVIDFSRVTFFDSTALGVLIGFNRNLTAGGILTIAAAGQQVLKIFEMTGLDRTFHLFPTLDSALEHVQRAPLPIPERPDDAGVPADQGQNVASETVDEGPGSGSIEPVDVHASLTEDAAVVVGIVSTAMPFAQSPDAQAERWLGALRRSGDAGILLKSLGTSDEPLDGASKFAVEDQFTPRLATDRDVVATVTRRARLIADARKHRAIRTNDLLGAVMNVYGPTFDRVLARHGVNTDDLIKQLGVRPRGSEPTT